MNNKIIEDLIDAAMQVGCFDWDWNNESIPEVKSARDRLRQKFRKILKKKTVRRATEGAARVARSKHALEMSSGGSVSRRRERE